MKRARLVLNVCLISILAVSVLSTMIAQGRIALSGVTLDGVNLDSKKDDVFVQLGWESTGDLTAVPPEDDDFEVSFQGDKVVEVQGTTLLVQDVTVIRRGTDYSEVRNFLGSPDFAKHREHGNIYRWQQDGWWLEITLEPNEARVERIKIRKGLIPG